LIVSSVLFFFYYVAHQYLHSFPTRRSSDLPEKNGDSYPDQAITVQRSGANARSTPNSVCSVRGCMSRMRKRRRSRCSASQPSIRSEEHTSELQSRENLVCRLLLEKKNLT